MGNIIGKIQSGLQSVLYKNAEFAILKQARICETVISVASWLQVGCKLWHKFSVALTPSGDASGIGVTLRENCVNTQKSKVHDENTERYRVWTMDLK